MKKLSLILALAALSVGTTQLAAADAPAKPKAPAPAPTTAAAAPAHADSSASHKYAVAIMRPTAGNKCSGKVHFVQDGASLKIVADIEGLTPGQKHGIHVHQFGDPSAPDGVSAGGHFNPEGHMHALPTSAEPRHAGDLGNLEADKDGKAHYELTVDNISIAGHKNPILGRGLVIHAKPDTGAQPTGNAGDRIAVGVIGVASANSK